jgi:hypothetical protein
VALRSLASQLKGNGRKLKKQWRGGPKTMAHGPAGSKGNGKQKVEKMAKKQSGPGSPARQEI